jgi:peroxiredoxin
MCANTDGTPGSETEYPPAPDFSLEDVEGNVITLADYDNKILFLNFWATWCGPCRKEIPDFIEVYDAHQEKGLEIIGISLDRGGTQQVVQFAERNKINYPIAMATQSIMDDYQPGQFIPTTIIIDRDGKIRHKHVGVLSKSSLEKYFQDLSE